MWICNIVFFVLEISLIFVFLWMFLFLVSFGEILINVCGILYLIIGVW